MQSRGIKSLTRTALLLLAILLVAGSLTEVAAQLKEWKQLDPTFVPIGRDDHMMAFDSDQGLIVMFGGDNAGSATWVWDGTDWKDLGISGPAPRREAAMAYDKRRKKIVMFGGFDFVLFSSLVWELDLETEEWDGLSSEDFPAGRSDHAMVYFDPLEVCIMHGGENVDGSTWAWDGETWVTLVTSEEGPGERWGHRMVYDSRREVIVLFGGVDGNNALRNDTWEFDGTRWREVTPAGGIAPPEMRDFAMAYDERNERVVLFGGRAQDSDGFDRTWEYDGVRWQEIATTSQPSMRHETVAAYDSWRDRVVLFGGSSGDLLDDRYNNETWWYPNNPPVPEADALVGVTPGDDVTIQAEIVDYDGDLFSAFLFFRTQGEGTYQSVEMAFEGETTYSAIIPGDQVQEPALEYYVAAIDPAGSNSLGLWNSPDSPHITAVSDTGRVQIKIDFKPARNNGAAWQVVGGDVWYTHNEVAKLAPGSYEIRFATVEGFTKPPRMMIEVIAGQLLELAVEYERN